MRTLVSCTMLICTYANFCKCRLCICYLYHFVIFCINQLLHALASAYVHVCTDPPNLKRIIKGGAVIFTAGGAPPPARPHLFIMTAFELAVIHFAGGALPPSSSTTPAPTPTYPHRQRAKEGHPSPPGVGICLHHSHPY